MSPEFYEVVWVNQRGFVVGYDKDGNQVEIELTDSQAAMLEAFLYEQAEQNEAFIKGLIY